MSSLPSLPDEVASAKLAGLRYVMPKGSGIRRKRHSKNFVYIDADDKPIKDDATLERIKAMVIPPAWESVWISPAGKHPHPSDRAGCTRA